ncbi:ORF6N domain-containing protein [Sediminicola luteus]|uniref:DNA-binding protein n=1 Tax=Sediminicola luteus TaxID=319238 RepID=A0A2A4G3J9_9FLAO|nr:ORF6N domain-containing protein [Sediminicola luteus]PCE63539.1 DNA-binding protein [Sediminicola luteus]
MGNLTHIHREIKLIRGQQVLLDFDLAKLYGVETRVLKQGVRRNSGRFPEDFMFQLTEVEYKSLTSQIVTSKGRGGLRYKPFAFTEQGVATLSSVLRSPQAIEMNILIMRAFVLLRRQLSEYSEIQERLDVLERDMNVKFKDIHEALKYLLQQEKKKLDQKQRKRIGYK